MRIIAGSARGMRLAPVPPGTRPVSDRAREGLFSSLGEAVVGARVLDLFAGTGAMGLEALSRGASAATFVEREAGAAAVIHDNLARTRLGPAEVVVADVSRMLKRTDNPSEAYDLVLADPPYELEDAPLEAVLADIEAGDLLAPGWRVVLTRSSRSSTPVIPVDWAVARRLAYGDSLVFLYREV